MKITVLALFPEILEGYFASSIMARAVKSGLVSFELVNIRDYALDRHRKCDDEVFGGGAGMLMKPEPLGRALAAAGSPAARTVFLTPSGRLLNQAMARELALEAELVLVCGRYEGIDERIVDSFVTDEVSIGDYVLSSGEIAALVLVDAVYRLIPGVISGESLSEESFGAGPASGPKGSLDPGKNLGAGLLEYPQYTRPAMYDSMKVPEVLTSGNHAHIARWRLRKSLEKTLSYRPELLATADLPEEVRNMLREITTEGGSHEPDTADPGGTAQRER
jgi:tRNA (guanine37-N1)-methyltransferase